MPGERVHLGDAQALGDDDRLVDADAELVPSTWVAGDAPFPSSEVAHRQVEEVDLQSAPAQLALELIEVGVSAHPGRGPGSLPGDHLADGGPAGDEGVAEVLDRSEPLVLLAAQTV